MDNIEALYYALGEMCYAIAKATGRLTESEKERLHQILQEEFKVSGGLIDPTEIIFHLLKKEDMDSQTAYNWAIHEVKLNSQYFSESLKAHFIHVIERVMAAFPSITEEEQKLADGLLIQLKDIQGDPVFSHLTE
jgi:uncharacterized tellurite resistance protein B-like protein